MLRRKMAIVFIAFFAIILYGFICISSNLPGVIKNNSKMKISVQKHPFEMEIDMGDYVVYINDKPFAKIKEKTQSIFKTKNP